MTQTSLPDARMSLGAAALDDLFPEGEAFRRSIRTFVVLLTLASFIASFGLYQDSIASIIGAMVVAPLGGAILAISGALVTGRTRWQSITIVQVALGSLLVVAVGFIVSSIMPDPLVLTPSIHARTQPGLLDLGVALAAGAAGAYVAVRRTGSDALPGVAIAVSLVPPLATVGICLELGRPDDAAGAVVLFLTNFGAIVVASVIVFVLAGAVPSQAMRRERRRLRVGFALAIVALVLVSIPLAWGAVDVVRADMTAQTAAPIVKSWLSGQDLRVSDYKVDGERINLTLEGSEAPAGVTALASSLSAALGAPVDLTVEWVKVARQQVTATPPSP